MRVFWVGKLLLVLISIFAFFFVFTVLADFEGGMNTRYRADVAIQEPSNGSPLIVGTELIQLGDDKVFYRFVENQEEGHSEDVVFDVHLKVGKFYGVQVSKIIRRGSPPTSFELSERLALYEGERLMVLRYELVPGVICLVAQGTNLMRCMARPD